MNNKNENMMNGRMAVSAALDYLGIAAEETLLVSADCDGALFELVLCTEWLTYDCYIDAVSGNVAGVDLVPTIDFENMEAPLCAEMLANMERAA